MAHSTIFLQKNDILNAILKLIVQEGWKELNLSEIARKIEIDLGELYYFFPSKLSILDAFFKYIDQKTLSNIEDFHPYETSRNRLFSNLMVRFDVLNEYKPLIAELTCEGWKDPALVLYSLPQSFKSFTWLLEASEIETRGLLGHIRLKIFALFYFTVILTWLDDNTPDMSSTMAFLDKRISYLEQIPGFF